MSRALGTLDELPRDYRDAMNAAGVAPLWPMMRNVLPLGSPQPQTRACLWRFDAVRPLLMRAGELTPVEKAERRVLVLSDPGRGVGAMQATASIYVGLQLLLPGEAAPSHRHTPSAARIVVEGEGGFTIVDGEKLPMQHGDLILTPGGRWHEHGHEGRAPVIWLDALDLPLFVQLEGSYAEEAPAFDGRLNKQNAPPSAYVAAGLRPVGLNSLSPNEFPMLRYPWARTEESLRELSRSSGADLSEVDFINPCTGCDVLPTLGFSAMMIRAGATIAPCVRSSSAVFHVVAGRGRACINGEDFAWVAKDTFSTPVFAEMSLSAEDGPAFLMRVHDRPLQQKLGYYEERTSG